MYSNNMTQQRNKLKEKQMSDTNTKQIMSHKNTKQPMNSQNTDQVSKWVIRSKQHAIRRM